MTEPQINSQNPQKMKKAFWAYFVVIALAGSFVLGLYVGRGSFDKNSTASATFVNTGSGKPSQVDFKLFWDVYNTLQQKYVDRPADNQKILYGAIDGMVKSLGDPYTAFMTPQATKDFQSQLSGSFDGIGIEIGMKNNLLTIITPIQDSPGQKAGLQGGDVILKIDDKDASAMSLDDAVQKIRGKKGTSVKLTIHRGTEQKSRDFTITRDTISVKSVVYSDKGNGVFYIAINEFSEDTTQEFESAIDEFQKKGEKKLILDLRNDPGGLLNSAIDVGSEFIEKGNIVTEQFSKDNKLDHPSNGKARLKGVPTIILANGGSASASEIVAGALRDSLGVKIVGNKTFGKGSVQEFSQLADGSSLRVTIAKWLTPKGYNIHGNGLDPDVKVDMTDDDYKNNKDPQFDKAFELIKNQ
jgi:carboxyl-terminal processing protease